MTVDKHPRKSNGDHNEFIKELQHFRSCSDVGGRRASSGIFSALPMEWSPTKTEEKYCCNYKPMASFT